MCYSRLMFFIFFLLSFSFFAFFFGFILVLAFVISEREEFFRVYAALVRAGCFSFFWSCCLERFGGLVLLDFAVAGFASATYLRRRLRRPSWKSYLGVDFALRCFQRLFWPDSATLPCYWRNNRCTGGRSDTVLSY